MVEETELCFPQLLNSSCRRPKLPQAEAVLIYILLFFFSALTAALNLLVIISISHFRQLHTPTNLLLLSLAVSDFIVGFLLFPAEILNFRGCWFLGDIACALNYVLGFALISVSVGNMVLISADRYIAVCEPMYYPSKVTLSTVKLSVCLCWMLSVLHSSWILRDLFTQPGRYSSCKGQCVFVINYVEETVDLVLTFIIPITVITVLYLRVFVVAASQARAIRSQAAAVKLRCSVTVTAKKSEVKAARNLLVLIIVFLLCFTPFYFYNSEAGNTWITVFVIWVLYFNSCLNPIIYALFYPWFRKAVKLIVTLQILQPGSRETNML